MSLLGKIKSWFSSEGASSKPLCIVDGGAVASTGQSNGRLNPREQIQLLRKIALFAEREGCDVQVVFEGRSLREVAHGEDFGTRVKVFFANSTAEAQEIIRKLTTSSRSRCPVVVAANRKFEEEMMALGARAIRAHTFRKGMDLAISTGGGEPQRREGQTQSGRRRDRNRRTRGRPPQATSTPGDTPTESGSAAPAPSSSPGTDRTVDQPSRKPSVDSTVRSLIDLVE